MPEQQIPDYKVFDELEKQAFRKGFMPGLRSKQAFNWYRRKVRTLGAISPQRLLSDAERRTPNKIGIGNMVMFFYNPKYKKKLPYYDTFPLSILIESYNNGFLGLNLHYLSYKPRIVLLRKLMEITNNNKFDESTKFSTSYSVLKGFSKFPQAKPCVKRYLSTHIQSNFLKIPSYDWITAIFLPVEQFQKSSRNSVWGKSRAMI